MKSSTVPSRISRPLPITTNRSAVNDISERRWEETSTLRPSTATQLCCGGVKLTLPACSQASRASMTTAAT